MRIIVKCTNFTGIWSHEHDLFGSSIFLFVSIFNKGGGLCQFSFDNKLLMDRLTHDIVKVTKAELLKLPQLDLPQINGRNIL